VKYFIGKVIGGRDAAALKVGHELGAHQHVSVRCFRLITRKMAKQ
jgi:hypothetical protein